MTKQEYDIAYAGLKAVPQRHVQIDGQRHVSIQQLNAAAAKAGLQLTDPDAPRPPMTGRPLKRETVKAKAAVQTPAQAPAVSSAPSADPKGAPTGKAEAGKIPENLGTLNYNQLKALAKDLGISPVPDAQPDLVAAIEAKRETA